MNAISCEFFASTAKGLEVLLTRELAQLGALSIVESVAGVSFRGPFELGYKVCLHSRIASRVFLLLKSFSIIDARDLYEGISAIEWLDHIGPSNTFVVDFRIGHDNESDIRHSHFGALKVKDAIVDQVRGLKGQRPSVDPLHPDVRINCFLSGRQIAVSIDLSGDSLHRRGYREEGHEAPLKENLAAALVTLTGWPEREGLTLLDPMCGSGTLLIEAALIKCHIAPGLLRQNFGFLGWRGHEPQVWDRLIKEAQDAVLRDQAIPKIIGHDQDGRAVRVALSNIAKAGLSKKIHVEKRDLSACEPPSSHGVVLCNPPYGERLGEVETLRTLYRSLGDILKHKFKGWEAYIFTSNPDLAKSVGLRTSRRDILFNGSLECRLLKYELY